MFFRNYYNELVIKVKIVKRLINCLLCVLLFYSLLLLTVEYITSPVFYFILLSGFIYQDSSKMSMSIITITDSFVPFVTTTSCYDNAFMYRNLLNPFHLINMLLINRSAKSKYLLNILFFVTIS